jgi:hypothetical protein
METKDQLVKIIKEWVKIDNEIRQLRKEENSRKSEQKKISKQLIDVMSKNEIDAFDLSDGKLMYLKKTSKKPITKKVLLDILSKYYKGDVTKAGDVNDFIMSNREEVATESIVRKINESG